MGKRTLAPMLKAATSMGPTSRSIVSTSAVICSSLRASDPKARALPPSASMRATRGASLSAVRRVTQAVKTSRANLRAMAPPVESPAPITRAALALDMIASDRRVHLSPSAHEAEDGGGGLVGLVELGQVAGTGDNARLGRRL